MEKTTASIAEYLAYLEPQHREVIESLIEMIFSHSTEIEHHVWTGTFWGGSEQHILGFGEYGYTNSKGERGKWFTIGLARQKNYYSLYVTALKDGQYLTTAYKDKLGKVKTGSSSISFTKLANVNLNQLDKLLGEAVTYYHANKQPK